MSKFTKYLVNILKFTKYSVNSYHQKGMKHYVLTNWNQMTTISKFVLIVIPTRKLLSKRFVSLQRTVEKACHWSLYKNQHRKSYLGYTWYLCCQTDKYALTEQFIRNSRNLCYWDAIDWNPPSVQLGTVPNNSYRFLAVLQLEGQV